MNLGSQDWRSEENVVSDSAITCFAEPSWLTSNTAQDKNEQTNPEYRLFLRSGRTTLVWWACNETYNTSKRECMDEVGQWAHSSVDPIRTSTTCDWLCCSSKTVESRLVQTMRASNSSPVMTSPGKDRKIAESASTWRMIGIEGSGDHVGTWELRVNVVDWSWSTTTITEESFPASRNSPWENAET